MTASLLFAPGRRRAALVLASVVAVAVGCTRPARDAGDAASLVAVTGAFLADGSCRALVDAAPLFMSSDGQRTTYDPGPIADIAPAGYTLRQLTCAPAGADATLPPDHAGERIVLVTVYAREGAPLRRGRYAIRAGLAADDTAGVATRAGVAIFGARTTASAGATGAGVRYLEGREGTLTITSVNPSADGDRVVGTFSMQAGAAWSM